MCKIIVSLNQENNQEFLNFVKNNRVLLEAEKDGGAVFVLKDNGKYQRFVSLDTKKAIDFALSLKNNKGLVGIHTRTSTSGKVDIDNLHFWIYEGFAFAHNGIVEGLNFNPRFCDSRVFFHSLLTLFRGEANINKRVEIIKRLVKRNGFWGVSILIDINHFLLYLFSTRETKIASDCKGFFAFTSFEPIIKKVKRKHFCGFSFEKEGKDGLFVSFLDEGIYVYDIKQKKIIKTDYLDFEDGMYSRGFFKEYGGYYGYDNYKNI